PTVKFAAASLLLAACATPQKISLSQPHREPELITVHHRVEKGQTLYRIARAYGLDVDELMAANGLEDPALQAGQDLLIPGANEPKTIADADAAEPAAPDRALPIAAKKGPVKVGRPEGSLSWPLRGVLYAR